MELRLGKITNPELAKWFGIGLEKFKKEKIERLKLLAHYCSFHETGEVRKTLVIDEIYTAIYEGDKPKAIKRIIPLTQSNWESNGYDTIANLQQKNKKALREEEYSVADSTINRYTYIALKDLIGYGRKLSGEGRLGRYEKVWGVTCDKGAPEKYRPLTEQEKEFKAAVSKEFFKNKKEDEELAIASIIEYGIEEKMTQKETDALIGEYKRSRHEEWINEVSKAIGRQMIVIVKADWSAFENEK